MRFRFHKVLFPLAYALSWQTTAGIKKLEVFSKKHGAVFRLFGSISALAGFIGMAVVAFFIVKALVVGGAGVSLVLPFKAKGVFYVPLLYWLLSLVIVAFMHELGHAVVAAAHGLKLKSAGFALVGIIAPVIPAAFVEPDEKKLALLPRRNQNAVFAAGPFANITAGIVLMAAFFLLLQPLSSVYYEHEGLRITGFMRGGVAEAAGLAVGDVVTAIDGHTVKTVADFEKAFVGKNAGNIMIVAAGEKVAAAKLAGTTDHPLLGIYVEELKQPKSMLFHFIYQLVYWLYLLSIGVGLFNLLPLGPIDGGRMLQTLLSKWLPEVSAKHAHITISLLFLSVVVTSLIFSIVG